MYSMCIQSCQITTLSDVLQNCVTPLGVKDLVPILDLPMGSLVVKYLWKFAICYAYITSVSFEFPWVFGFVEIALEMRSEAFSM